MTRVLDTLMSPFIANGFALFKFKIPFIGLIHQGFSLGILKLPPSPALIIAVPLDLRVTTTNSTSKRGKRNVSSSKVSLRKKDSLEQHTWHLLEQRVGRLRDPSRSPAAEGKKSWICWLEYRTRHVMAQKVARACETVVLIELNFNCFFTHPSLADPASLATNGE